MTVITIGNGAGAGRAARVTPTRVTTLTIEIVQREAVRTTLSIVAAAVPPERGGGEEQRPAPDGGPRGRT